VSRYSERYEEPNFSQLLDQFLDRLAVERADRVDRRAADRTSDGSRAFDVKQAAVRLGVSPTTMHELVISGQVPSVKVGRRRVIAVSTIDRMLAAESLSGDRIRRPIGDQLRGIPRDRAR
jgi:excisionase family DNA binding protein